MRNEHSPFWLLIPIREDSPAYDECRRLAEEKAEEDDNDEYLNEALVPAVGVSIKDLLLLRLGEKKVLDAMLHEDASNAPFYLEATVTVKADDLNFRESLGYLNAPEKWPLTESVGEWIADLFESVPD